MRAEQSGAEEERIGGKALEISSKHNKEKDEKRNIMKRKGK